MGLTSLQVCMDSSDWLQGTMHDDDSSAGAVGGGINNNSSSSPSGDGYGGGDGNNIMGCSSGPMRLKPPADQAQKCPRCDSAHTKFCYYNNYSLSQPRYFCKTCRRYWTKGGTLRNIPVGGGCRKNNASHKNNNKHNNNKRTNSNNNNNDHHVITSTTVPATNHTDLQLSTLIGAHHLNNHYNNIPNFLDGRDGAVDFADPKQMEALRNYDVMGNINIGNNSVHLGMDQTTSLAPSFQGLCSPFGIMGLDQHVDSYQRFMVPYDVAFDNEHQNVAAIDVKPKLLALDQWQDQGCGDHIGNRDSFAGYMGSWSGMINGYGSSR